MDSLSQLVLGASLSLAVMGRRTAVWKAALWGGVAGTLLDLDVLLDHGDAVLTCCLSFSAAFLKLMRIDNTARFDVPPHFKKSRTLDNKSLAFDRHPAPWAVESMQKCNGYGHHYPNHFDH